MMAFPALHMMSFASIAIAAFGQSIRGATQVLAATNLVDNKNFPMLPYYALGALAAVPVLALIILYRAKGNGWCGAFGLICFLITAVFVYAAVVYPGAPWADDV